MNVDADQVVGWAMVIGAALILSRALVIWMHEGTRGDRILWLDETTETVTFVLPDDTPDGQLLPGHWDDEPDPEFVERLRGRVLAEHDRLYGGRP